jgi:hypothetical protein
MNTRDYILLGAGAVVGYFLVGIVNKNKSFEQKSTLGATNLLDVSSLTIPPATTGGSSVNVNDTTGTPASTGGETLVDPRVSLCEENWAKFASIRKFGSQEQAQRTKDNFIASCLAKLQ